ncbi:MAG: hypothetical protein GXO30_07960 [Epsilonproteobacteria bacterium]|nr:hypothetical protein [Campylobacterota bacterium]
MSKYLYGASIQGIQGFIFETNKLQEIVGASDLIEWFCSEGFLARFSKDYEVQITKKDIVRNAGGNIRIVFEKLDELEKMVREFPKYIMQKAYGITISQAVVEFEEGEYLEKKDELEHQLSKARNQAIMPLDARFALMKQTPRTGKPAFKSETYDKGTQKERIEYFDKGNWQKKSNRDDAWLNILLNKLNLKEYANQFSIDMDKIANTNNKVAVIHADGNKMGLMLQQMNKDLKAKEDGEIQKIFKEFSHAITKSTNSAVEKAFIETFDTNSETIKFRPIVIGGDDVTVICDANRALEFTKAFLEAFEDNTKKNFKESNLDKYAKKLTACAGISFCNSKFPFHYAVDLAEHLCSYAKEKSNREASCLAFHNIQSSFVEDYQTYIKQELTTKEGIELLFAPYFIKHEPKIETLIELHKLFSGGDISLGKYREWLSELHKNQEYAELFLERVDSVLKSKNPKKYDDIDKKLQELNSNLKLNSLIVENKTPMQDILQLKSVMGGSEL